MTEGHLIKRLKVNALSLFCFGVVVTSHHLLLITDLKIYLRRE